ncbi:MAG TPA: phosphoenolpyruvate--protein phosphotransferase, partial [candidate division Zixibacteria bacterium]|nr:phosphoenolpyruvate--protein phosphotransferase [candidate division Zixibacteria bacterium]
MAKELRLQGIAASPGIGIGRIFIHRRHAQPVTRQTVSDPESELRRFARALERARAELDELRGLVVERLGTEETELWDAQMMMLSDPTAAEGTRERIRRDGQDAASAFHEVMEQISQQLDAADSQYLKERASDIRDITWRVVKHVRDQGQAPSIPRDSIVLAHELSPADAAYLATQKAAAMVTEIGGKTSHTAIIARSLEIPAVVGIKGSLAQASQGDWAVVDGNRGTVILNPLPATLESYRRQQKSYLRHVADLRKLRKSKAITRDGHQVELSANIELPEETVAVLSHGAKGVGLFRTEFLYLTSDRLPTEDEQYAIYRRVAEKLAPDPVIIRTFDLGGDKIGGQAPEPEANPFLGWRAIRFCLDRPELFKAQIRAILKASAHGQVKIMFPMICCLEELRRAKAAVEEAKQELRGDRVKFDEHCQVGIMIETPAAALTATALAQESDFFSIGSNDLTQYTLAVDRTNHRVARMYDPFNPAVLRLVREVIECGHRAGIWVGMCGEMCADPLAVPLLLGLSLDEFSMNPVAVPEVKRMILNLRLDQCRRVAARVMEAESADKSRAILADFVIG